MKKYSHLLKAALVGVLIALFAMAPLDVSAQNANQTYPGGIGPVFDGNSGPCWEGAYLQGVNACIHTTGYPGNIGVTQGQQNLGWATLANTPVVALATATTGGSIPAGTSYRLAVTDVTITGGETAITSTQEATQTTTGSTSTITVTAPIAAAGAAGYRVYSTNASGVGNSNTTLTELSQPITTTVCAGAFQVNGPLGPATGPWVCPFGTNAVLTTITTSAATVSTPSIPGSGPATINGGLAIPAANTASYPAAIPEAICNFIAVTANTTSTSITTMATCPLTAGVQNTYGKVLHVTGHGVFTATGTPTVTISVTEGGITPVAVAALAETTGGQTNSQFSFDFYVSTGLTGTAGKLEAHGNLYMQLATASNTTALAVYGDTNTALSSALDLTAQNNLVLAITGSSGVSASTLRDAQIVLMN